MALVHKVKYIIPIDFLFLFNPEAEFLDGISKKVFRVFLLAVQGHLYSFALRFIFLQTHATSYSFYSVLLYTEKEKGGKTDTQPLTVSMLLYTVKEKGGKTDIKPHPLCRSHFQIRNLLNSYRAGAHCNLITLDVSALYSVCVMLLMRAAISGPKKVEISRAQPLPTSPRNGCCPHQKQYARGRINHRCKNS
jgi:hypothetical protein